MTRRARHGEAKRPRDRALFVELPAEYHEMVSRLGKHYDLNNRDVVMLALRNQEVLSKQPKSYLDEMLASLEAKPTIVSDVEIPESLLRAISEDE